MATGSAKVRMRQLWLAEEVVRMGEGGLGRASEKSPKVLWHGLGGRGGTAPRPLAVHMIGRPDSPSVTAAWLAGATITIADGKQAGAAP
jgi:hypothetical protein